MAYFTVVLEFYLILVPDLDSYRSNPAPRLRYVEGATIYLSYASIVCCHMPCICPANQPPLRAPPPPTKRDAYGIIRYVRLGPYPLATRL